MDRYKTDQKFPVDDGRGHRENVIQKIAIYKKQLIACEKR